MSDEIEMDLGAWEPPAPPAGLADAVIARMHAASGMPALDPEPAPRRPWLIPAAVGLGIGAIAATTVMLLDRPGSAPSTGEVVAANARHLVLPAGTVDTDPGADVSWQDDRAEQRGGAASWHVNGHVTIAAGSATIDAKDANLRVEVTAMNPTDTKTIGTAALTSAVVVSVLVYSGAVTVSHDGDTQQVAAGSKLDLQPDHSLVAGTPADPELERLRAELQRKEALIRSLQAEMQQLETPGSLASTAFAQAIAPAQLAIDGCGHRASTSATMDARIEIGPDGNVTHVEVPATAGDAYRGCVVGVVTGVVFPRSQHGGAFALPLSIKLDHDPFAAPAGTGKACDADALELAGDKLLSENRPLDALDRFESAITCRPSDVRANQRAVIAACAAGNQARAQQLWMDLPAASRVDDVASTCRGAGVALDAPNGRLHVRAVPAAKILIDGQDTHQMTPAEFLLPAGKHKVTLVIGDDKYTFPARIESDHDLTLDKTLQ